MTTIIKLKRKGVGGSDPLPSDLEHGELAINFADGKLYYKNSSNAIAQFLDSGQTVSMIDSAYINDRINSNYLDSAETINLVDSAYVNARLDTTLFLDSAEAIQLIDSAYVNARLDDTLFLDSAEAINLVDSAYVNARLDTSLFLDSAEAISLVDSAYVNARLDTSLFLDSAETIALVDSAYVNARLDTTSFLDSAEAHNILDSMFANLDQHLVPITTEIYDLGDSNRRFRDLYLSGTSVTFGNIVMSEHNGAARFTNHTTGAEVKVDVSNVNTHLIDSSVILDVADSSYIKTVQYLDDEKAIFGNGDDLQIFHHNNGTGIIQNAGAGQLQLRADTIRLLNQATDEDFAFFNDDGSVDLYHNNIKRFETTTYGATVTGSLIADSASVTKLRLNNELVDSAWVNARLDTTSFLDSAEAIALIDSAYVNARLDTTSFLDSAEAVALIDSAYVQARQLNFDQLLDSAEAINLIDSSYIQARTRIGLDDIDFGSKKITYSNVYSALGDLPSASTYHGMFAHVHGTGKGYFAHGGNWIPLVDSANFSTRFDFDAASSSLTIDGNGSTGGVTVSDGLVAIKTDTGNVAAIDFYCEVNNAHRVKLKAPAHANFSGNPDVVLPNTSGTIALKSELFSGAWADITGTPTTISGYGITDALIDSGLTTSLIDSAYIQARQSVGGGTFGLAGNTGTHTFNTATETLTFLGTTGQINAGIAANNVTLELDQNINSITSIAFEGDSANNNETKIQAVNPTKDNVINLPDSSGTIALLSDITGGGGGGGTVDSAATITIIQNTVDSAYVTARATLSSNTLTLQDEGNALLNDTTTINFVGSGVAVSGTTTTKTVTISGGGGGGGNANVNTDVVVNTFNGDSSTTAFTLSSEPTTDQNVFVTINGVSQHIDAYSLAGSVLTLSAAPEVGDVIETRVVRSTNVELRDHKDYIYQPNPASLTFSGSDINGDVLSYDENKLEVFYNGSRLTPGLDFTATNGTSVTLLSDFNADSNDTIVISSFSKASLVDTGITPGSATIGTAATQYVADTYNATTHRTSKYLIELAIDSDNKYHATEVLLTHNGTTVFMSQYGHVISDSSLGEFDADINSGNVRLLVTPSLNNTTIKTQRITIGA